MHFHRTAREQQADLILRYKGYTDLFKKFLAILLTFFLSGVFCVENAFARKEEKSLKGNVVINIDSEQVDYLPDEEQFIATGHVKIHIFPQNTILEAEKVTYDKAEDLIIAERSVKITKNNQVTEGDYARIDLTTDSILIENPVTELSQIRIVSKRANILPSKKDPAKKVITAYTGTAKINNPNMVFFISSSGSKFIKNNELYNAINTNESKKFKPRYDIHSKEIIINRDKYTDIIILKNSTITINKKYKIAKVPSILMTTDRDTNRAETTFPEIGHMPELGGYVGYGPVFILPRGTTLKLVPLFTYGGGIGGGGMARLTTDTHRVEAAYSSLKEKLVMIGEQKIIFPKKKNPLLEGKVEQEEPFKDASTKIQYGCNSYISNGFLGTQKPKLIIELVDDRKIFSAYNLDFDLRSTAAFIQTENNWSTGRYQTQGILYNKKPLFSLGKVSFGTSSQFNMAVYGNGDTYGILRAGPTVSTLLGPVYLWAAYYQGGVYGDTPLEFDRYYYGRSNITFNSSYQINRFITFGYRTSLNLSKDNYDKKLFAENRFYFWVGPKDIKFMLAYDTRRKSTTFDFNMLIGADRSKIKFDKLTVREN